MGKIVECDPLSWKVSPRGTLRLYRNASYGYETGEFVEPRGIVSIYREPTLTALDLVHDGHCHRRSWKGAIGDLALRRLAREMLTEIVGPTTLRGGEIS